MARSADETADAMIETINDIDETIDVEKGPVLETSIIPWSTEVSFLEGEVEHFGELFQLDDPDLWRDGEMEALGRQLGIQFGEGEPSQGFLTFYTTERPTADIAIPLGSIAADDDSEFLYATLDDAATLYVDTADAFYNATTRRYEIKVAAEATETGTDHDLRPGRIRNLLSSIDGIDGVTNEAKFEGGSSSQSAAEFADTLRELPLGNSLGTPGGFNAIINRVAVGSISDSAVVTPADIGVFERSSVTGVRAAVDLYVLGSRIGIDTHSYTTVTASETDVVLPVTPVVSVSSVLVNGAAVTWSLVSDSDPATRGTTSALDKVVLDTAPGAGANVFVSYTYNKLITDLQEQFQDENLGRDLFRTAIVVRTGKAVEVVVDVELEPLSVGTLESDVEDAITNFFQDPDGAVDKPLFIGEALPEDLKKHLQETLGVKVIRFAQHNRPDIATTKVQDIAFDPNEYPSPLTITLRT